jgi:hypothetical protein
VAVALWERETHRKLDSRRGAASQPPVTLRLGGPADLAALERLAGLDSRPLPPGPLLIAERDGRIDAALSLSTDELVADPFRRTAELGEMLRCHAGGVGGAPQPPPSPQPRPQSVPVTT